MGRGLKVDFSGTTKWQEHLKAAETSGKNLTAYAAQYGINVRRLYESRYRDARAKAAKARKSSAFVPVKVRPSALSNLVPAPQRDDTLRTSSGLTIQARLANGVVLSWSSEPTNASAQANLLHTLAGLPCFPDGHPNSATFGHLKLPHLN